MFKGLKVIGLLMGAVLLTGFFSVPAYANINSVGRYSQYSLSFDNLNTFANARGSDGIIQTWTADNAGDSSNLYWNLVPNLTSYSFNGDANMGISNISYNPVSGRLDYTTTALTALGGQTNLHIDYSVNNAIYMSPGNQYYFQETFNSTGGVNIGGQYYWQMVFQGDWSGVGTGLGQHQILALNAAYTNSIDKNFVYDSITDTTTFLVKNEDYQGAPLGFTFRLYGETTSVPEPATILLLCFGLAGIAGVSGKKFKK
jgi:hypothetical protein